MWVRTKANPSLSLSKSILQNEEPPVQTGWLGREHYVRTVNISVQTRQIVITISRGDDTVVVVIPI